MIIEPEMTIEQEAIKDLANNYCSGCEFVEYGCNSNYCEIKVSVKALQNVDKIRDIVTRGLKAQDPINLYKANCLKEIAELLEIKIEPEDKPKGSDQMTIDDII